MIQNDFTKKTLAELTVQNYKFAEVFEKYGLDFCCNGDINFSEACKNKGVDEARLIEGLSGLISSKKENEKYENWELDFLVDYIINNHHHYIQESAPKIQEHLKKIIEEHSKIHPELIKINNQFDVANKELQLHMIKEERILFPYIKQMTLVQKGQAQKEPPYFGTVENPIKMMKEEHENVGTIFKNIKEYSHNYEIPKDGCATYSLTINELREFEEDLHKHIHLENNILFPKSMLMEKELFAN